MSQINQALVVLTGAAGGFGQQFMRQMLPLGARFVLTDKDASTLESVADTIRSEVQGGEIVACVGADISTREGCEALYQSIGKTPDVLINNAGLGIYGRFNEIPIEKWEMVVQVNFLATLRLTHLFLPAMIERKSGHIVNIASIAGWLATEGMSTYGATKFGVRGFSEGLAHEVAPYNIKVTTVYPFYSKTPILNSPRYGTLPERAVPDNLSTDPKDVIAQVVNGMMNDTQHVFPDRTAKLLQLLTRYAPWIIPPLSRYLDRQAEKNV